MASVPLKCELVTGKHCLAWKWTKVTNWMLEDGVEIAEMTSGRDFVVYLTSSGQLLYCGMMPRPISYEKFRLHQDRRRGRAHAVGTELKRLTKRERAVYKGHSCDSRCCPVELPLSTKTRVLQVACGVTHCHALGEVNTADGLIRKLFSWGLGEYGQLGLGECRVSSLMTPISVSTEFDELVQATDAGHPIVLRCGAFSTYLLSKGSSILWHWGLLPSSNDSSYVRQGVPVRFPLLDENTRLVDVAAGVDHVVFLSEDGCVFSWGYGSSGQLGLGPSITSNVDSQPTPVDFFHQKDNHNITSISCGWNHNIAISRNGDVYAWGSNTNGACGAKSKFCEYFHPVLVAVPRPVELGLVASNQNAQIRCGGNSSALFLRHVSKYAGIKWAFIWGVNALDVGILLPIEVVSSQNSFADCCMRLESLTWLVRLNLKEVAPAWIMKEIGGNAESRQRLEKGIPCLNVNADTQICIKVQAISKIAVDAITALPENCVENSLFQITSEHDPVATWSDTVKEVSISSVTQTAPGDQSAMHASIEIIITAQAKGRAILSLTSSIGEVIGNTFAVDIAPQNASEATTLEAAYGSLDNHIRILGVHIEGTEAETQERVDANWYRLLAKRIRVYTDDSVIVLIETITNDMNPAVQVEHRDNHWQYDLKYLDVVGSDDKFRLKNLSVVQLRFSSPGQYFIYETKTHEDEHYHRTPLLIVNCCMTSQERTRILRENHDLVWSKYQSAQVKQLPVQFSSFLSLILQQSALRDSVVCSPWIITHDEACCESSFDFDREVRAQYVLMNHPERPFILWDEVLTATCTLDSLQQYTKGADSSTLNSILPNWAQLLSSKVSFRIATWLGKPNAWSTKSLDEVPIDYKGVRSKGASSTASVQQIPFDFLGNESLVHQPAIRIALMPANPNIMGVHDSIVSWKRMNGDLFYTVQSNDLRVQRYGHESHDFPETAQSGRITRLKTQLSDFLWQAAEGKRLEDLFFLLTSPTNQELAVSEDHKSLCIHGVIQLRELIFHTTALGFNNGVAIPKQEWFALFRAIQALSQPHNDGITFNTFRIFLIDPVHQFFWKQYVHRIRERANSNRATITQALSDGFQINDRVTSERTDSSDGSLIISWSGFVEGVKSFHSMLGLEPLSPSDCCRLLYRFDARGNGQISIQTYQNTMLRTLGEIDAATLAYDFTKTQRTKASKGKQPLKVAIANGHRRPNVELFTSSEAVHKLFAARAKTATNPRFRSSSNATFQTYHTITNDVAAKLRASANTHLARIRNLPISHLLREGIHFRPPRETMYRCEDDTQAEAMDAEESY